MTRADAVVMYENDKGKMLTCGYTEFEHLQAVVKQLRAIVEQHTDILNANHLVLKEEVQADYFDEDKLYRELTDGKE